MKKHLAWLCLLLFLGLEGCKTSKKPRTSPRDFGPMGVRREMRAVWIATVDNIDWPSRKNLSPEEQRAEFVRLLDTHKRTGINAVFVQVRAAADAFYAKSEEPWSEWLTGKQGKAPEPFYDPMEFMIEECHRRGMEFHAWLNLNRVAHRVSKSIASNNIGKVHPEWVFEYDGYRLFNFGLPEVRDYITNVTTNIVKNYDVDGIHFDDYFYPYTVTGQTLKDEAAYQEYGRRFRSKDDWRRDNIDKLIKQISDAITAQKSYVKFGVSPFGVWRNKQDDPSGSPTQAGQTSYDNLYADTKKWMKAGWIDYMVPQIYFSTKFDKVPFRTLTLWWLDHTYGRHLYIGQGAYRVGTQDKDKTWADYSELPRQMRFIREYKEITGSVFYSSKSLVNNKFGHADSLRQNFYKEAAFPPPMPWKDRLPPLAPRQLQAKDTRNGVDLRWIAPAKARDGDEARYYAVYRYADDEEPRLLAGCYEGQTRALDRTALRGKVYTYAITALDRLHNESEAVLTSVIVRANMHARSSK
ncbi:family 10 glycosylhydrolase [Runella sp. MFBS21]|uniref:glycoside hydrolase family 10 protein n=1 Tax=Runella sp. MFBS21 TaxID=3034018 RepID=UPI0023F847DB|nr:family 10 glycosylhydrolase [Runella sp. MFBS21]MDF7820818.1 family 10 glycosylhydrolase [Runella sp. MFBS21]